MEGIAIAWNEVIIRPMINSLVVLYHFLFSNFGLSIIAFTVLVRLILLPLTLKQTHQMKRMMELQPKMQELQKRFAKDRQKLSQETLRLYRQAGVNPLGCLGPFVIQMPIWIGLYQALIQTLPTNPDALAALSQKLYSWLPMVHTVVPLSSNFLWLDLVLPDRTPVLPILVGASTWVQQKMSTLPSADPRTKSTNNMMLWMMPIMLAIFSFTFPSGLSLYWVISNIVGIVIQYFITGWGPLFARSAPAPETASQSATDETKPQLAQEKTNPQPAKEIGDHGDSRGVRQDGRRSHRTGATRAKRKARGSRSRDSK